MGEPQHAIVALDEAGVDGLVDRRPGRRAEIRPDLRDLGIPPYWP
jgi:hypothetical protein